MKKWISRFLSQNKNNSYEHRDKRICRNIVLTLLLVCCLGIICFIQPVDEVCALTFGEKYEILVSEHQILSELRNDESDLLSSYSFLDSQIIERYDQNPYGTCYAQALAQTINISYEHQMNEHIRVSSLALALQIAGNNFDNGAVLGETLGSSYSMKYISEYDFPYDYVQKYDINATTDYDNVRDEFNQYDSCVDVVRYVVFPDSSQYGYLSESSQDEYLTLMKRYLNDYGALSVALRFSTEFINDFYTIDRNYDSGSHAVTIIGYDDSFSGDNFNIPVSSSGAFQVLNSWGNSQDVFYVPYEDVSFLNYVYGVIVKNPDRNTEVISNVNCNIYSNLFNGNTSYGVDSNNPQWLGVVYENQEISYVAGIDLMYPSIMMEHGLTTDVDLYINTTSGTLDEEEAFEYVGSYDLSEGMNKLRFDTPVYLISSDFAIKIYTQKCLSNDINPSFLTVNNYVFDGSGFVLSDTDSYGKVTIPFLMNVVGYNGGQGIQISNIDNNIQFINNLQTMNCDILTNNSISTLSVMVEKYDDVEFGYAICDISYKNCNSDFVITTDKNNKTISIKPKTTALGYYKVTINVNDELFTKYITIKNGTEIRFCYVFLEGNNYYHHVFTTLLTNISDLIINCYNHDRLRDQLWTEPPSLRWTDILEVEPGAEIVDSQFETNESGDLVTKAIVTISNSLYDASRTYSISFVYDTLGIIKYSAMVGNASNPNPDRYSQDQTVLLEDAESPTHNFWGWYLDEDYTSQVTSIDTSSLVIYNLYAKWEQKETRLTFDSIRYDTVKEEVVVPLEIDLLSTEFECFDLVEIGYIYINDAYISYGYNINKNTKELRIPFELSRLNNTNVVSFDLSLRKSDLQCLAYSFYPMVTQVNYEIDGQLNKVAYEVQHWQESLTEEGATQLGDKFYTLVETEEKFGFAGDEVSVSANGYTGFSVQTTDQKVVIADDTVVDFLYNRNEYDVKLLKDEGITLVSGAGKYLYGQEVTISATLAEGYEFSIWESLDTSTLKNSTHIDYTFTIPASSVHLTAKAISKQHTISITKEGMGTVDPSSNQVVGYGSELEITFTPAEGYELEAVLANNIDITDSVNENKIVLTSIKQDFEVYVVFKIKQYFVTALDCENGTITPSVHEVEHGGECSFNFTPKTGYYLYRILIDGKDLEPDDVLDARENGYTLKNVTGDHTISAIFYIHTYTITVTQSSNGTISSAEASYNYGSSAIFSITPSDGYHVSKLIVDNSDYTIGDLTTYTFENITTNHTISAKFAPNTDTQYTVKHWRESLPDDYDTATQFGDKFYHLVTLDTETLSGTTDTSTSATAKTYTGFTAQTIEQKTIAGDKGTIVDIFYNRNSYTLTLIKGDGIASVTNAGTYLYGEEVVVSATLIEGYRFLQWKSSDTGKLHDDSNIDYLFYMPAGDITLTAEGSIITFVITIETPENGKITPSTEQVVNYGSSLTLEFEAFEGYALDKVLLDSQDITADLTQNKYTLASIKADYTISAVFKIKTYTITAESCTNGQINPSGVAEVNHGSASQKYEFKPDDGYHLTSILVNGVLLTTEEVENAKLNGYKIENVAQDYTISATFAINTYIIEVEQSANGTISDAEVSYNHGSSETFAIKPAKGYHIVKLIIDESEYTTGDLSTYTFENIDTNHTISAVFAPNVDTPYTIKHWQESLTQTGATKFGSKYYTLVENDTLHLTGITGTKIDVVYNTYTGFTAIEVVETTISGDGDTIVNVLYDRNTYKITLIKGEGVSAIGGVRECVYGNKVTLSVTMLDSHDFVQWKSSDESTVASSNISNYSFTMPASDIELTAEGTIKKFTITIEQPENGTIEPSTDQEVIYDSYLELEFKASEGYELDTVILQGKDITQDVVNNKYTIQEIQSNYTVKATFKLKKYAITATSNANGAISPSGVTYVEHNQSQTYTFKPDMGYYLASVVVDSRTLTTEEMEQVKANGYTFEGVTSAHTIVATFAANAETPYTIKHWQESLTQTGATKIGDKYYTLVLEEGAALPTGTLTNVVATTYEGFTAQTIEQKKVSGDGRTIVDVLYNRNTYSLTVVSGDADQISSVRGTGMYLFGQAVTVSATMKEAYQFSLWVSSKPETLANSTSQNYTFDMPAGNIRLTAQGKIKTFVITMQNPTGGQLQTQGEPIVEYGSDFEVEFVANTGYELDKVFLDDEDVTESVVNNKYILINVVSEHELSATFKLKKYTITVTSGEHGSITPDETKVCEHGVLYYHRYDFIPDEGYQVLDVTINGQSVGAVEFYMFNYITESKDVYVTFEKIKYTVDVTSGENGQVSPSGKVQVEHGDSKTFTITPDNGFGIAYIKLNDQNIDIQNSVTITDITTNQKLEVGFERVFFIKATSEGNGDITPSALVISGTECTFTFTPSEGYEVKDVQVDGESVGAVPSYTFTNVTEPHTISVEYRIKTFDVKLSIEGEGRVEADEIIDVVTYGDQRIFTINPDNGWEVHKVYVDGESVEVSNNQFAINAIKSNVNIEVVFKEKQAAVFSLNEGNILLIGTGAFIAILVICLIVAGVKHKKLKVAKVAQTAEVENTEQLQPRQNLLYEYDKAEHVETPKEENAPDLQEKEMLQKAYDFVKGRESYFVSFCARYHIDYQTNVNAAVLKYYQAHLDALNNPNGNKDI